MKHTLLVAIVGVAACSGKAGSEDLAPTKPVEKPQPAQVADASCTKQVGELRAWLTDLTADGRTSYAPGKLASVDAPPTPSDDAEPMLIAITPAEVTFYGTLISPTGKLAGTSAALRERLEARLKSGAKMLTIVADQDAPWSAIVAVANTAKAAGVDQLGFVLHATGKGRAAAPGASSIDAELETLANPGPATKLAEPKAGGLPGKVFARCQPVLDWMPQLAGLGGSKKDDAVIAGLPSAIERCGCKVEVTAVRRLMWAWWNRDAANAPTYLATVKLGAGTTLADRADAKWSVVARVVFDAAKQGTPIQLAAK